MSPCTRERSDRCQFGAAPVDEQLGLCSIQDAQDGDTINSFSTLSVNQSNRAESAHDLGHPQKRRKGHLLRISRCGDELRAPCAVKSDRETPVDTPADELMSPDREVGIPMALSPRLRREWRCRLRNGWKARRRSGQRGHHDSDFFKHRMTPNPNRRERLCKSRSDRQTDVLVASLRSLALSRISASITDDFPVASKPPRNLLHPLKPRSVMPAIQRLRTTTGHGTLETGTLGVSAWRSFCL